MGKSMEVSQKTKNIVPDNLATPLLDTYPKKTKTQTKKIRALQPSLQHYFQ